MKSYIKINMSKRELEYVRDLIWSDYKNKKDKDLSMAMMLDALIDEIDLRLEDLYEDEWK